MNTFEEINALSAGEIAARLRPAKVSGVVCPNCNNGLHENGKGITPYTNSAGLTRWKCHSCGAHYSNVDIWAAEEGKTAEEIVPEYEGKATFSLPKAKTKIKTAQTVEVKAETPPKDYSEFYFKVQNQLEKYVGENGEIRGLPLCLLQEVGAGIATAADLKAVGENVPASGKYLILPYNQSHFFIRQVNKPAEGYDPVKRGNTGGKASEIYKPKDISADFPLLVTEGQIDCLSLIHVGFDNTIATNGTANFKDLPQKLSELKLLKKPKVIIIGDNDTAGVKAAKSAVEELKLAGYAATAFFFSEGAEKVDANKILQADDGIRILQKKVVNFIEKAEAEFESQESEIKMADRKARIDEEGAILAEYFSNEFEGEVKTMQKFNGRATGFKNLDDAQILLPGLYIVGGVPSIGKTTFLWQMLNQMAQNGETCIYCSYEMSRLELFSKVFAREMYLRDKKQAFTAAEIRRGSSNALSREVFADFKQSRLDLRVIELKDENVDTLLEKLKKICAKLDKPPVIAIDYLQIIPSDKDTAKAAVDDTARKLKVIQRETGVTFFIISNLNRANYAAEIAFESFKESGGIEFSADVIWGLQFWITKNLSNTDVKGNRKKLDAAKKKEIREIHLKCLKNRNGKLYDCYFKYHSANEYFEPVEETKFEEESDEIDRS